MNRALSVLSFLFLSVLFLCLTAGTSALPGQDFEFRVPATTVVEYPTDDPRSAPSFEIDLSIVDLQDLGIESQGFSMALTFDAVLDLIDSLPSGPLVSDPGSAGPDFYGENLDPDGGPGFTVAVVVSFSGMDTVVVEGPPEGSPVVELTFRVSEKLAGVGAATSPLEWSDGLGDPPITNRVVVEGEDSLPLLTSGEIELVGVSEFIRGDCNGDSTVNIADGIHQISLLVGSSDPIGDCFGACDPNGDGSHDLSDPIYLLNHQLLDGPPPPAPFPDCGEGMCVDQPACV